MSLADDLANIESGLLAMRGMNSTAITATKVLTGRETGFLLVDATAATVIVRRSATDPSQSSSP